MTRFGLLVPHFGLEADQDLLVDGARLAESLGFDSVWVRDHLVFHPHGMEGDDRTHINPLVTLSLVASATDKLILGTGSLIPHRNPIHTALLITSLQFVAKPRQVIVGFKLSNYNHEFEATKL